MGRWWTALLLVIILLVAGILIVPSFVDWNAFRAPIEREASRLAGRQVAITGDIDLSLLPAPSLSFKDVTIADPKAPKTPLLSAGRIEASAAWLPLFLGRIEVARIGLVEPIIRLRINEDGTYNWGFRDSRYAPGAPNTPSSLDNIGLAPRDFARAFAGVFQPSRFTVREGWIERGTLLFSDMRNGAEDWADKITGRFVVSKEGAFNTQLAFVVSEQPLRIEFAAGAPVERQPTNITAKLGFLNGEGTLLFTGTATNWKRALERRSLAPLVLLGHVSLQAQKSGAVGLGLRAIAEFDAPLADKKASVPWSRVRSLPVALSGTLDAGPDTIALTNAHLTLGQTMAAINATHGRRDARFDISVNAEVLYLDELVDFSRTSGERFAPLGAASGPMQSLGACRCEGTAKLIAPKVVFGGTDVSDLSVEAHLSPKGGEITTAHINMPGGSTLDGSGKLPAPGQASGVVFDGQMAFKSAEPRKWLDWLRIPTDKLAPDALKTLALEGPVKFVDSASDASSGLRGTIADHYVIPVLSDAKLKLDNQTFTLSAAYDDRAPRRLMLHLNGDWLDADAYGLNMLWLPAAPLDNRAWSGTLWGRSARAGDVDVAVKLGSMHLRGRTLSGFAASVMRTADGPANGHLQIADLSGYRILFDGTRSKTQSSDTPPDINASLTVSGPGRPIHLPLAGKGLPGSLALNVKLTQSGGTASYQMNGSIGSIKLDGIGTGNASTETLPDIDTLTINAQFAQGRATLGGSFHGLTVSPLFDGALNISAKDFAAFMRELGYSYEPRRKDLGALALQAKLSASNKVIDLETLSASVGKDQLNASGSLEFGPRNTLDADLHFGGVSLDGYLPPPDKKSIWSSERLKLDVFRKFDGRIGLTAERFEIGPYDMHDLSAQITLKDSIAAIADSKAQLYGGALTLSASTGFTDNGLDGSLRGTLSGLDWTKAGGKLFPALGSFGTGRAEASFAVTSGGNSMLDLARRFSGTIDVSGTGGALEGFDVPAWSSGLTHVASAEDFLRLVKSSLGDGTTGLDSFKLSAKASNGKIRVSDGHLALNGGTGTLAGSIDLPRRTLSFKLAVQPTVLSGLAPAGIVVDGPIGGPARYYDLKAIGSALAPRFGLAPGEIKPGDVPKELRDLLRTPPSQ